MNIILINNIIDTSSGKYVNKKDLPRNTPKIELVPNRINELNGISLLDIFSIEDNKEIKKIIINE